MPNLREIVAIVKGIEFGAAKALPNVTDNLIADLPGIFGGRGMAAAAKLAETPAEAMPVAQLAEAYQSNLARYGLGKHANLNDLYTAAREHGVEPNLISKHHGFRNSSRSTEISLADGSILTSRGSSSRHGAYHDLAFLKPGSETKISFSTANTRMHGRTASWSVETPNFSHVSDRVRTY